MMPTRTLGEAIDPAPLDAGAEVAETEAEDSAADVEGEVAASADEGLEAAELSAAEMSWGIMRGVLEVAPRSTDPSARTMSGLVAKRLRVKRTFSATRDCDQSGRETRSMFPPQLADGDPVVILSV